MALTKAPTYGKNSFYSPVKPKPAIVKPKPVIPYLSGGAGGLAQNPIFTSNATLAGSMKPAPATTVAPIVTPQTQKTRPSMYDYVTAAIPGDWEVQAAETALGEQMGKLRSQFTGDIRDAFTNLGIESPDVQKEFGSYIDQDTIAKAIQNKYSASAQIADQAKKARANTMAALAARGALRSGSSTNRAATIESGAQQARYQAVQDFLSGARGGLRGLGEAQATLDRDVATARSNAGQRWAKQYGYDYPEETPTTVAPATGTSTTPAAPKELPWQRALRLRSQAMNKRYGL